jgi:WD repeat-containing protein 24
MKTVTASQTPTSAHGVDKLYNGEYDNSPALQREATLRDISTIASARYDAVSLKSAPYYSRSRPRSEAYSNDDYTEADRNHAVMGKISSTATTTASENLARVQISEKEARLREAGWEAMRETLEILLDDVSSSNISEHHVRDFLMCMHRETFKCVRCWLS